MNKEFFLKNPRIIIVQKLYSNHMNADQTLTYPAKHKYKKFIKDVVTGTIERREIINEVMINELKNDLSPIRTDIILKIIIMAAIFEFMYKPQTPLKVIINEYLSISQFFLEDKQKKYLNAILDKLSKKLR